jgi:hypothetical protein
VWTTTAAPAPAGTNTAVSCRRLPDARDQPAKGQGGSCSPVAPTEADIPEESVASVNGAIVLTAEAQVYARESQFPLYDATRRAAEESLETCVRPAVHLSDVEK